MNIFDAINSLAGPQTFVDGLSGAWFTVGVGFVASLAFCILLVLTKSWHGAFSMDANEGVQKFHSAPTPRIGGVAIISALWVAWLNAPEELKSLIGMFLLAGLPAFIFGLAEDITKKVSVLHRLLATMASGLLAWWLTDYTLTRVDVWGIDYLLTFTLVYVLFTSFAVGGVANSINIIDGFNGLAFTTSTVAFAAFAILAHQVGDAQLAAISLVLAACVWGFFWVNWPYGKIFLGDGGSYFIGFSLAWVAVMLIERNPQVSAFAALLICVHPVTEVLFSVYRRKLKKLQENPDLTQRELADKLGMSVGSLNYCLNALIDKGFVKMENFSKSKNKFKYVYLLTPQGIAEKVALTSRFLRRKMVEYEALKLEIEALKSEAHAGNFEYPTPLIK